MIVIRDPMQVVGIPDPAIRRLVSRRMEETCAGEEFDPDINGYMVVVESGDDVPALEQESGCPIMRDLFGEARYGDPGFSPCFEVLEEHPGCYEMVFIMTDGDFGISLFIPKTEGINPELLAMCVEYAVPAPDLAEA